MESGSRKCLRKTCPKCDATVHVKRAVCGCGHAFALKRKARCYVWLKRKERPMQSENREEDPLRQMNRHYRDKSRIEHVWLV